MKSLIYFYYTLFLVSCISSNFIPNRSNKFVLEQNELDSSIKNMFLGRDSTIYSNMMKWGKSKECADLVSQLRTNMNLIRVTENENDFNNIHYNFAHASLLKDSLKIVLTQSSLGSNGVYYEKKPIIISIIDSTYTIQLVHTTDHIIMMYQEDGNYIPKPFIQSKIESASFTLNKKKYAIGDTLIGDLHFTSSYSKEKFSRKKNLQYTERYNEIGKGWFRVIVEDGSNPCLDFSKTLNNNS